MSTGIIACPTLSNSTERTDMTKSIEERLLSSPLYSDYDGKTAEEIAAIMEKSINAPMNEQQRIVQLELLPQFQVALRKMSKQGERSAPVIEALTTGISQMVLDMVLCFANRNLQDRLGGLDTVLEDVHKQVAKGIVLAMVAQQMRENEEEKETVGAFK